MVLDPAMNMRKPLFEIITDLDLRDGQIYKFKPLEEALEGLADADDRRKVNFSHLQNQLAIRKNTILIPTMNISTNVGDFSLYGKQYFNLNFDYYVRVNVSDMLLKKWDLRHFEKNTGGRTGSELFSKYMFITGNVEEPRFGQMGRAEIKNIMERAATREKQSLSTLLTKEFPY